MDFIYSRSAGARVSDKLSYKDLRLVVLENDAVRVVVVPEKGAEILSFVDKQSGVDVMARLPNSVRSPKSDMPLLSQPQARVSYYSGGWHEMFPVASDFGEYHGLRQPFHGETPFLAWDYAIVEDSAARVAVEFKVRTVISPFALTRRMILDAATPEVRLEESIENLSDMDLEYMWGHHPAFGAPFLSGDCRIELPKCRLLSGDETLLSIAPENVSRGAMFYATDLSAGIYGLRNQRLGFGFGMSWDHRVFAKIWIWQSLHAQATAPHYKREYVCALEPFTSLPHHLFGQQDPLPVLRARQKLATALRAFLYRGDLPQ